MSKYERAFETAEIGKFDAEEITAYEDSLKYYRDLKNVIDTSFEEGLQEGLQVGREEGLQEGLQAGREEGLQAGREEGARIALISSAEKALRAGLTNEVVSVITGLSLAEIEELRKKLG